MKEIRQELFEFPTKYSVSHNFIYSLFCVLVLFWVYVRQIFLIILIQIHHKSMGTKDGMKFWWLPWFPAKIYGYIKLWETLYTRSQNVWPKTKVFIIRPSVFGRRIKRLNIAKCLKYSSREGTCAHDLNFLFLHM